MQNYIGLGKIYLKKSTGVDEPTIAKKNESLKFLQQMKGLVIIKKGQVDFLLENYSFKRQNNFNFNLDKFRSFVTRKNVKRIHYNLIEIKGLSIA